MQTPPLIAVVLAIIVFRFAWRQWQRLQGWQRLFGVIAVVATFLIVLQPEFLALGLFGDTAFFDMLALALSLQMHWYGSQSIRAVVIVLSKTLRWWGIPSPGLSFLLAVGTVGIASAISAVSANVSALHPPDANEE